LTYKIIKIDSMMTFINTSCMLYEELWNVYHREVVVLWL